MKKLVVIMVVVLLMSGLVMVIYRTLKSGVTTEKTGQSTSMQKTTQNLDKKALSDKAFSDAIKKISATDADLDGLSDEQEKKLGTDANKADTDNDGILDPDEINIYHSDPLKADTDGDGYKDGYEVGRGFSPIGKGKLTN